VTDAAVYVAGAVIALALILRWHRRRQRHWSVHLSVESEDRREEWRDNKENP
jgi:hypothetical protein